MNFYCHLGKTAKVSLRLNSLDNSRQDEKVHCLTLRDHNSEVTLFLHDSTWNQMLTEIQNSQGEK